MIDLLFYVIVEFFLSSYYDEYKMIGNKLWGEYLFDSSFVLVL